MEGNLMPNIKPIDYNCMNTGAHGKDVLCSSCIPVWKK